MPFWADGEDMVANGYHTNFKFKTSGEVAALFSASGELVDGFEFSAQKADISCALVNSEVVFMNLTPNLVNSESIDSLSN